MIYASEVWWPRMLQKQKTRVEILHRAACRAVAGLATSTDITSIYLESNTLPIDSLARLKAVNTYETYLRLPVTDPGHTLAAEDDELYGAPPFRVGGTCNRLLVDHCQW